MGYPEENLVAALNDSFGIELKENISLDQLKDRLAEQVNYLVDHDFNKLVSLLYRIDVNETRLRQLLIEHATYDAGRIIADLVIERQLQKIKSREQFQAKNQNKIDENEKW